MKLGVERRARDRICSEIGESAGLVDGELSAIPALVMPELASLAQYAGDDAQVHRFLAIKVTMGRHQRTSARVSVMTVMPASSSIARRSDVTNSA